MFKNIERKQKLIDEREKTKEKVQTSLVLFNSKFLRELNCDNSMDESNALQDVSETFRLNQSNEFQPNKLQAVQYINQKKRQNKNNNYGMDLEDIINYMSRFHEESKVVASRIETQFSEITLQNPVDEMNVLSFLNDYDATFDIEKSKGHNDFYEIKNGLHQVQ